MNLKIEAEQVWERRKKVVIYIAPEGFCRKGGEGNYIRGLSQAMVNAGNMAMVVEPWYRVGTDDLTREPEQRIGEIDIPVGNSSLGFNVLHNDIEGVHHLRVKNKEDILYPEVYPNTKVWGLDQEGKEKEEWYSDSLYGYIEAIILSKAPMEIAKLLGIQIDVMHFNDWQTGFGPAVLEHIYRSKEGYKEYVSSTGTVIITHNITYQGVFVKKKYIRKDDELLELLKSKGVIAPEDIEEIEIQRPDGSKQIYEGIEVFKLSG